MKYTLKSKLSASYMIMALLCVVLISILTNFFLDRQFKEYIKKTQEEKNASIVISISNQYKNGLWSENGIENIGVNALENGLIIKVKNIKGETLWDAAVHNNGMCQKIIEQMTVNMKARSPQIKGGFIEKNFDLVNNFKKIGEVVIGYYGPFYLSNNDLAFINTLNNLLTGVGVLSLFLALILGTLMARRITRPILKVIEATDEISKGNYTEKIMVASHTKEIDQLTESVNMLAKSLENQEKLRKRLTSDVAHELRTPLTTLQSHMEAMIDGIWKADSDRLKSCHEEILRISRMVGDLSNLAKYEAENLILDKTEFDLSELSKSIIRNFESEFINKNVKISFEGKEEKITSDKDKISQILVNLISNALKYTESGGNVKVKTESNKEFTILSVKDTGIGIPKEDLNSIFERFYRVDKSRNRLSGGAGIGLTITKSLVEAHNGKIEVVSNENEGSEFKVFLPKN